MIFSNKRFFNILLILLISILSFLIGYYWRWYAYQTYDYKLGDLTYTQIYPKNWPTYALFGAECIAIMEYIEMEDDEGAKDRIKSICSIVLEHIKLRYPLENANGQRQLKRLEQAIETKVFHKDVSTRKEN